VPSLELAELRESSLGLAIIGSFLAAPLCMLLPDPLLAGNLTPSGLVAAAVALSALGALALRGRSVMAASAVLVVGLTATLGASLQAYSVALVAPWMALLVVLSTSLLGMRAGVLVAVVLGAALPTVGSGEQRPGLAYEALLGAALAISWLLTRPVQTALDWSWHGYERALEKMTEAQQHRGELVAALRQLNVANHSLEAANAELSRARAAAARARDLKARFAAFVSHELRLPLNLITGFSEMMVLSPASYDGQTLPPAYRADVEAVYRAAQHLSGLIDDVLDLSELDAHRMGLDKAWGSMQEVVEQAVAATSTLFEHKGLALTVEVPADLPPIHADLVRIRQVLMNLLKNAVRFTDSGGVHVSVSAGQREMIVSVADTGIGVSADDLPHVFEEFRQIETAGARRWGGSGLGLTISKQFVEMHGGSMTVESEPGQGSTFRFSLPIMAEAASIRPEWETWARAATAEADAPAIGVMADDPRVTRLIARHLERYRAVPVSGVADLRRAIHEEGLSAVVAAADAEHTRLVPAEIAQAAPSIPLVACTVRTSRTDAAALGVADYLVKPVDRDRVARTLAAFGEAERILIVEDDPEMSRLLAAMVRSVSPRYHVTVVHDGAEALAAIEVRPPDVVLLDLVMPTMGGHELIQRLRASEAFPLGAVIVVSAGSPLEAPLTAEITRVTRRDGLSSEELLACLSGTLDGLLTAEHAAAAAPATSAA
jgi:signal transduction histidine kinase/CheY-like chemotaxis protein